MSLAKLLLGGRLATIISFFSVGYLGLFLPICLLAYGLSPKKARRYVLLGLSYLYYWFVSGELVVYLLLSTLAVHYFGLWLDRLHAGRTAALAAAPKEEKKALRAAWQKKLRGVVLLAALLHIGLLISLKYTAFFTWNLNTLMAAAHVGLQFEVPVLLQPLGISFFTLQGLSYILDVYRGTQKADDNLPRLGLFMAFFPQIVEGPICRYRDTAEQLWSVPDISLDNLKLGLQRILYGAMKKLVVADRLDQMVKAVFSAPQDFEGGVIAIAAIAYTVELYMDFSGSMDAVCGVAQIFGIKMPENFQRPFFARSISEFWQRWHITLGAWFRDYVFYPVSTSRPMKALTLWGRRHLGNHFGPLLAGGAALFCVWSLNGLWHGPEWHYVLFGLYHFVLIFLGSAFAPASRWLNTRLRTDAWKLPFRVLQSLRTALLVVIGEVFFRADDVKKAFLMLRRAFTGFTFRTLGSETLELIHMDVKDFVIVGVALLIVFGASLMSERGVDIRDHLSKRRLALRWAVWYALILFVVIFGAYGVGYTPVDPMYANF